MQQILDLFERVHDPRKLYEAVQRHRLPTELRLLYEDLIADSVAHATINRWIHMSISLKQADMYVSACFLTLLK